MIYFAWLIRLPGILFLSEVKPSRRVGTVIKILTGSTFIALAPQALRFWFHFPFIVSIALWVFSAWLLTIILSVYSDTSYKQLSLDERWRRACIETGFLLMNPDTMKKQIIPRIIKKLPNMLLIHASSVTARELEEISDKIAGAMGIHIWSVRNHVSGGEMRPGLLQVHYTTKDLPHKIPLSKMPKPDKNMIVWGMEYGGWFRMPLRQCIHGAVIGQSGQGKSVLLRSLLVQLYCENPGSTFLLLDFKAKQEFGAYEGLPNVAIYDRHKEAVEALRIVYGEYKHRSNAIVKHQVEHAADLGFPPIFIFVDELAAALAGYDKPFKYKGKNIPSYPGQLAAAMVTSTQLYRSAHIYVFAGTQRMDAKSIPAQFRENLGVRCAFKVGSKEASMMLLNYADAFKLPNIPGRFILASEIGAFKQLQAPYISKKDARQYMQEHAGKETDLFQQITKKAAAGRQPEGMSREDIQAILAEAVPE